jgi:lipopolysaccharide/colanic/teichoic acid biosynthesis glycosyltransferase
MDGETGILFSRQTAEDLAGAVRRSEGTSFDPGKLRQNAERFSSKRFRDALQCAIQEALRNDELRMTNVESSLVTRHPSFAGVGGSVKRTLDLLLAISGLALLGLPLLLMVLLIRLTSPGPGLFFQMRVGPGGRSFRMVKLRTMRQNAEKENAPMWAMDGDPRCTPLGDLLRRYGIDELPQLWNILKGEMSFVGPRPERPEFHRLFSERDPRFARRLEVRGGLTGLAQVRGWRGNTSVEGRLESDLEYIDTWSPFRDLLILLQTPLALWRGKQQASAPPPQIPQTNVH